MNACSLSVSLYAMYGMGPAQPTRLVGGHPGRQHFARIRNREL